MSDAWRDVQLADDGEDLIYETEGDAERGNPLDITGVVTVNGGETVLGLKFPRKPMARELARRWNACPALLAACELWDHGFTDGEQFDEAKFLKWVNDNRRAARAAIARYRSEAGE